VKRWFCSAESALFNLRRIARSRSHLFFEPITPAGDFFRLLFRRFRCPSLCSLFVFSAPMLGVSHELNVFSLCNRFRAVWAEPCIIQFAARKLLIVRFTPTRKTAVRVRLKLMSVVFRIHRCIPLAFGMHQEPKIKKPPRHQAVVSFGRSSFGTFVPHIERLSLRSRHRGVS